MSSLKKPKETGRGRLIASAIKLFSKKSFHGVSVREICEDASANISSISFHFGGKDSLLGAILEEKLLEQGFSNISNTLASPKSKEQTREQLQDFLNAYIEFYLKHQDVVTLFLEELERGHKTAKEILPRTFGALWESLVNFILDCKEKSFINKDYDEKVFCCQILGPINNLIRGKNSSYHHSNISLADQAFRKKLIDQMLVTLV